MAELRTEEEQIEALKRWWNEHGKSTILQVAVVAALYFGWQGWQTQQQEQAEAASVVYQQLLDIDAKLTQAQSEEDYATANHLITSLKVDYDGSTYAQYAAMIGAKYLNNQEQYSDAVQELDWVLAQDPELPIALAATLRKARVLSNSGDIDAALAELEVTEKGEFAAAFAELAGDLYFAKGDMAAAKEAYQTAVNESQIGANNPLLTVKLDSVVTNSAPAAAVAVDAEIVAPKADVEESDSVDESESVQEES